ncbi:spermidine synthase (macronuclear) [Tetrahymena thermophila SB210]|uniref:Spermidine synthase n=1 Tax=Tetrahymena thermophila (strain SB210) TaxID=312017 RepID=I7M0X1_TETTS|nr:spermidine synthase [Tetrahymena thermophila SB210]EAR92871.1 spermidine synthase [Tetrahymena thermophila SB210]|eukprot:XP_001013116.1 spermidine synthase [Tetrahymena thermophila SB210]
MNCQLFNRQKLGNSIFLDFKDIENLESSNLEMLLRIFEKIILTLFQEEILRPKIIQSDHGKNFAYLLSNGVCIMIYTWEQQKNLAISYYDPTTKSDQNAKLLEEAACEWLGWQNCTSNISLTRGEKCKLICNESENKSEILFNSKLIYREMTPYQELRVYDTLQMGRILLLDDMVQITQEVEDNYTIDMVAGVVNKNQNKIYDHILIIGGGDMLIANYLLEKFSDVVQKITICEIDQRVIEVVKTYFFDSNLVNESIEKGKLNIVYQDGSLYAKELADQGKQVDGVIIDCTDFLPEGGVSSSLFTEEFYINITKCLKNGCFFSQQLSYNEMIPVSKAKWDKLGLTNYNIILSKTPEYGENLPIAYVQKTQ